MKVRARAKVLNFACPCSQMQQIDHCVVACAVCRRASSFNHSRRVIDHRRTIFAYPIDSGGVSLTIGADMVRHSPARPGPARLGSVATNPAVGDAVSIGKAVSLRRQFLGEFIGVQFICVNRCRQSLESPRLDKTKHQTEPNYMMRVCYAENVAESSNCSKSIVSATDM